MNEKTRIISDNDMHILMSNFLDGARELHTAMCLFDDDHFAQKHLRQAMFSMIVGAQECTRLHGSVKIRLPDVDKDDPMTTTGDCDRA